MANMQERRDLGSEKINQKRNQETIIMNMLGASRDKIRKINN